MYTLSAAVSLYDGFGSGNNIVNNFIEGVDYALSGKSIFAILSSTKWNDVAIMTTSVSALDYVSADTQSLTSLFSFTLNSTNQPYLTGQNNYYMNTPFISAVGYQGKDLYIYPGTILAYYRDGLPTQGYGNIVFTGSDINYIRLVNCALSGVVISNQVTLSGLILFENIKTFIATDPQVFSTFIQHLCTYAPNNGNFYQEGEKGYNNFTPTPPNTMNPFKTLDVAGTTAMHHLTTIKNWTYNYTPDPAP